MRIKPLRFQDARTGLDLEILPDAIGVLQTEVHQAAYRVYELMQLRQPRDFCRYFAIKAHALPRSIEESVGKCIQLRDSDALDFCSFANRLEGAPYDPDPEQAAWAVFFRGRVFQDWIRALRNDVARDQESALTNMYLLTLHDAEAWLAGEHCDGRDLNWFPITRRHSIFPEEQDARNTPFFKTMDDLILTKDIRSVAYRGPGALTTFMRMCQAQHRRARRLGLGLGEALRIAALTAVESADCERRPDWLQLGVTFTHEGLSPGELFVEDEDVGLGASIADLIDKYHHMRSRYILLGYELDSRPSGFNWTVGEGITVGERIA